MFLSNKCPTHPPTNCIIHVMSVMNTSVYFLLFRRFVSLPEEETENGCKNEEANGDGKLSFLFVAVTE